MARPLVARTGPLPLGRGLLLRTTALLPAALLMAEPAQAQSPNAAPVGGQVSAGSAVITQRGSTTRIDQGTGRAVIDWRGFDVGRNHSVQFNQPSAQSWTLNRVNSPDPSAIAGRITANGGVAIVNQSGVVFAPGAQVNVGSLIASAANVTNENFMAGRMVFDGAPRPGVRVENHGEITVAERGLAALVAPGAANSGTIRARLGRVALAGAETFTLDLAGDGLVSLDVTRAVRHAPNGATALVTHSGVIEATGGSVLISAEAARGVIDTLVRSTGQVSADAAAGIAAGHVAIRGRGGDVQVGAGRVTAIGAVPGAVGGRVEVTAAGGAVTVAQGARVSASGQGGGGRVDVGGAQATAATVQGRVAARGAGAGARGGQAEVNAAGDVTVAATGRVNVSGTAGGGRATIGTTGVGRNQAMAARTTLAEGAAVRADATGRGNGGTIAVNSTQRTDMRGLLSARGGAQGGDGGFVELSGQTILTAAGRVDLRAPGGANGTLLIDPVNILIADSVPVPDAEVAGTVDGTGIHITDGHAGDPTTTVITAANIQTLAGTVRLEATQNLTVAQEIVKVNGGLTLVAGTAIAINENITVTPSAGDGFGITATAGTISLAAGRTVRVNDGTISLRADTLVLGGALNAGTGLVELGPRAPGAAVTAALPAGGITAGTLRIGQTSAGDRGDWGQSASAQHTMTGGALTVAAPLNAAGIPTLELVGSSIALNAPVTAGETIDLRATGAGGITQDAAGVLTAQALRARAEAAGASVGLATAANQIRAGSGPYTAGSLAGIAGQDFDIRNTQPLRITTVASTDGIQAADRLVLRAPRVEIAAELRAGASAFLFTDGLSRAGGGRIALGNSSTLTIGTFTAGHEIGLGATAQQDALRIDGDILQHITGPLARLRLGGAIDETALNTYTLGSSNIRIGGDVDLRSVAPVLDLRGRDVSQDAGTRLSVGRLVAQVSGNLLVTATGNEIDQLAVLGAATSNVHVTTARPLTIVQDVGGFGGLTADGVAGTISGATAGGAAPARLAQLRLIGQALTIDQPVAADRIGLRATAGDIGQGMLGVLHTGDGVAGGSDGLAAEAQGGSVTLTGTNRVRELRGQNLGGVDIGNSAAGDWSLVTAPLPAESGNALLVAGHVTAGTARTNASRVLTLQAGGTGTGTGIRLAADLTVHAADGTGGTGRIVLRTADDTGGLAGTGGIVQESGVIVAERLSAWAGGAVELAAPGNRIGTLYQGRNRAGSDDPAYAVLTADGRVLVRSRGFDPGASPTLTIASEVRAQGIGRNITLVADDLAVNADLRAATGTVSLVPTSQGRHIAIGRSVDAAEAHRLELGLAAAEVERVHAARLNIGRDPAEGTLPTAASLRQYARSIDLRQAGRPTTLGLYATGSIQQRGLSLETEGAGADPAPQRGSISVPSLTGAAGNLAWFGADNDLGALQGFSTAAGGVFTLRQAAGRSLDVTADVQGAGHANAGRITLATDGLTLSADPVALRADLVEILPVTAGRSVNLGGPADPTRLVIGTPDLGRIRAGQLTIGRSADAAVTGAAPAGLSLDPFGLGRAEAHVGDLGSSATGPRTAGDILLNGDVLLRGGVGTLALFAGVEGTSTGVIAQHGAARLDVPRLTGESRKSALLDAVDGFAARNTVDELARFRAGVAATAAADAAVTLLTESALTVSGLVSAGLRGTDTAVVAVRGGSITLAGRSVALNGDLLTAPADGAVLAGGAVRGDTSAVRLQATSGNIAQDAGRAIVTGRLSALASGGVVLDGEGNEIHALVAMGARPLGGGTDAAAVRAQDGTVRLTTRNNRAAGIDDASSALMVAAPVLSEPAANPTLLPDALAAEGQPPSTAPRIQMNGAGAGVRLRVDDLEILANGSIVAQGGTIQVQGRTDVTGLAAGGLTGVVLREDATLHQAGRVPTQPGLFVSVADVARMDVSPATAPPTGPIIPPGVTWVRAADVILGTLDMTGAGANNALRLIVPNGRVGQTGGSILNVATFSAAARDGIVLDQANRIARIRDVRSTSGDVTIRTAANTLQVTGAAVPGLPQGRGVEVASGRRVTLVADDLDIRAPLTAPDGVVTLRPFTAGRPVTLGYGSAQAGSLSLSAAELTSTFTSDGRIRLGATGTLRIGAVRTDGLVAGAGEASVPQAGNVTLGEQVLDFGHAVPRLEIFTEGDIAQPVAGASLRVGSLAGIARGSVTLGQDNRVAQLGPLGETDRFGTASGYLQVPGTASFLTGYAPAGSLPANGAFLLRNATGVDIAGDVQTRGTRAPLTITTAAAGNVTVQPSVSLRAGTGDAGQAYGRSGATVIGLDTLRVVAGGSITIGPGAQIHGTGSMPGALPASALRAEGGDLTLRSGAWAILGWGANPGGGGLHASNGISLDAGARANVHSARAGRDLDLSPGALITAATDVTAGRDMSVDGTVRAGGLVGADAGTVLGTGTIVADSTRRIERVGELVVAGCACDSRNISIGPRGVYAGRIENTGTMRVDNAGAVMAGTITTGALDVREGGRVAADTITAATDVTNRGVVMARTLTATRGNVDNSGRIEGALIDTSGIAAVVRADRTARNEVVVSDARFPVNVTRQDLTIVAGGSIINRSGGTIAAQWEPGSPGTYPVVDFRPQTLARSTLTLSASGAIQNDAGAALVASGSVLGSAGAGIQTAGVVAAGAPMATGTGAAGPGDIDLRALGGDIVQQAGAIAAPQGRVALLADAGGIVQGAAGRIQAARLAARGDAVSLTGFDGTQTGVLRGNAAGVLEDLQARTGDLAILLVEVPTLATRDISARGDLMLTVERDLLFDPAGAGRTVASGGNVRIVTAADLRADGWSFVAPSAVSLVAAGNITLARSVINPGTGLVAAEGGDLVAGNLRVATGSAPGTITLSARSRILLTGGSYAADRIVVRAGGPGDATATIRLSGAGFQVGTGILFAAGGGVGAPGDALATVAPRAGADAPRPLVIFETRRTPLALRDLPEAASPANVDQPGRSGEQQAWQVLGRRGGGLLTFGLTDGSGRATNAAAGPVTLNLDANSSPVFLLLDGGTATGTLFAGRLGVHGVPGPARVANGLSVDIRGRLASEDGPVAARHGRITGTSQEQAQYRFNNCVVDTINCVVTSMAQPVARPVASEFVINIDRGRPDPDVLLPNVAEEDY